MANPVENYWYTLLFFQDNLFFWLKIVLFVGAFKKKGIKITMQYYNIHNMLYNSHYL